MSFGHTCSIGTTIVSLGKGWTKLNMPNSKVTSAHEKQINDQNRVSVSYDTECEGIGQAEAVGLSDPTAPQNVCPQI